MPWKETNVMNEKTQFIDAMLKAEKPFKHICADFGISEKPVTNGKIDFMKTENPAS